MKKFMVKKQILIGAIVAGLVGVPTGMALTTPNKTGADNVPPIVQEVEHQGDVLKNHEDRINNNENDINDLQVSTGTPSSSSNTVVHEVTTTSPSEPISSPAPSPSPTPTPDEPAPSPTPPVTNPKTITAVTVNDDNTLRQCTYKLYNGQNKVVKQSKTTSCLSVGEIYPY